jgi:hypothetical protein
MVMINIGCNHNPKPFPDCEERPLTLEEKEFIRVLEKDSILGTTLYRFDYNYRPNYPYMCENQKGVYGISSYNTPISMYDDSIRLNKYLKNRIIDIYTHLMNDSLKYYTPCIEISFSSFEASEKFPKGAEVYALALKEDIERYFGKKLISGKKMLQWRSIAKVKELKICTNDSCGEKWW